MHTRLKPERLQPFEVGAMGIHHKGRCADKPDLSIKSHKRWIQPDATNMPLPNTTADSRIDFRLSIQANNCSARESIGKTIANAQCATAPAPPPRPQTMDMGRKGATSHALPLALMRSAPNATKMFTSVDISKPRLVSSNSKIC